MTDLHRRGLLALGLAAGTATSAAATPRPAAREAAPPLTPAVTEGPYYLANAPTRADIREGLPGVAMDLRFQVLDQTGAPLPGARVDVWHCDAQGRYSGFGDAPGREPEAVLKTARFLRGALAVDAAGVATFRTVYPGWYEGRTTHIHYKVWLDGRALLTSQVFLPDALNEFLYLQAADYRRGRTRDTLNSNDGIARQGGEAAFAAVAEGHDRFRADFTVVVDRNARPRAEGGPGAFGGPSPGSPRRRPAARLPGRGPAARTWPARRSDRRGACRSVAAQERVLRRARPTLPPGLIRSQYRTAPVEPHRYALIRVQPAWRRESGRHGDRMTKDTEGRRANPIDQHVGARVRLRRKMLGVSQEHLADQLGLTFQQVQKYERGENRVSASKLYRIATLLQADVSYFFEGLPDPDADARGDQAPAADRTIRAFLDTAEGLQLAALFPRIEQRRVRRQLVDLVRSMTEDA